MLLREVNERIREVNDGFVLLGGTPDWVEAFCECGRSGCLERVQVPSGLYEEIRGLDEHFLVAPGHEDGERVVTDDRLYRVVVLNGSRETERDDPRLQPRPARLCTEAS